MVTVTGFTAARMLDIENSTVVDGDVVGDNLILKTRDDTEINAGSVRGVMGPAGSGHEICTSTTRPTYLPGDEGKTIYETDTNIVRIWTGTRFEIQGPIMCTSASRPSLSYMVAEDDGTLIFETNTNLFKRYDGTLDEWLCQPFVICTSATRPSLSANEEGVHIYETDTNRNYFWNGSAWRRVAGDMGRMAVDVGGSMDIGDPYETLASVTIVTTEARIVLVSADCFGHQLSLTSEVAAHVDSTGTLVIDPNKKMFWHDALQADRSIAGNVSFTVTLPAGTTTFRIRVKSTDAAIRMDSGSQISVTDIGPA
jgi:hypothetical protein